MSTADIVEADDFAKVAAPLMREYVTKASKTRERLREVLHEAEEFGDQRGLTPSTSLRHSLLQAEVRGALALVAGLERFSRRVSQYLENEKPNLVTRMEIELRLVDLEQIIETLRDEAHSLMNWTNVVR